MGLFRFTETVVNTYINYKNTLKTYKMSLSAARPLITVYSEKSEATDKPLCLPAVLRIGFSCIAVNDCFCVFHHSQCPLLLLLLVVPREGHNSLRGHLGLHIFPVSLEMFPDQDETHPAAPVLLGHV